MKHIFLLSIKIYWLIPKRIRSQCLYKESCSNHVYRITGEQGTKKGLLALKDRIATCKPYYKIMEIDNQRLLICNNGKIIKNEDLAEWLK